MEWAEARDRSLAQWRTILVAIGERDPGEILDWAQAAYGLCEKARELAAERGEAASFICRLCLAYQQQGSCLEARDQLAAELAAGDFEGARNVAKGLIANLECLELAEGQ